MTPDSEALEYLCYLVQKKAGKSFNDVQRGLLQQLWQYPQKTYDEIAAELGYSSSYIKKTISPELWKLLTSILGETVQKKNFRSLYPHESKIRENCLSTSPGNCGKV